MENIPSKSEVLVKLNEIITRFMQNSQINSKEQVTYTIEFSIKYGIFDILFDGIFSQFFSAENTTEKLEIFIDELHLYIQNGIIRCIPTNILIKLVDYLIEKKNEDTIENMILHLDPVSLDSKILIPVCDKYNLINAYIYINTQSGLQSYINPLKKLYKLLSKSTDINNKKYFTYHLL